MQGKPKHRSLPPAVQGGKRVFISGQRLCKQLFVGQVGQQHHLRREPDLVSTSISPGRDRKFRESWTPLSYSFQRGAYTETPVNGKRRCSGQRLKAFSRPFQPMSSARVTSIGWSISGSTRSMNRTVCGNLA